MNKSFKNKTGADAPAGGASRRVRQNLHMTRLIRALSIIGICCLPAVLGGGFQARGAVNVTQHHNSLARNGLYIDPAFTTSNAANLTRDLAFGGVIVGQVYAQPLYIEGGPRGLAVIIAVTESNNVYALNATTGGIVWQTHVAAPVPSSALPCGNVSSLIGITGTPVVDLPSRALFLDALSQQPVTLTVEHLVFSLNVDTGIVNPGWPLNVNGNAVFGTTKFVSLAQGERGALTVIGTNLYVPYGGLYGDCGTYHGWVVGMPLSNPSNNVMAWATAANGGGAWSVGGLASDGVNPFVATGNTFNASSWGGGEAILKLSPSLVLSNGTSNYWSPTNWSSLDGSDSDIGGSGPLLVNVPGATPSNLVVALGKDGNAYLLNRTNLGGISVPLAKLAVGSGSSIIQAAATYQAATGSYVVFANNGDLYSLLIGASSPPTITKAWTANENGKGSPFVTSTDGTNNFVVWGIGTQSTQRLYGFNATNGATVFAGGGANELMANTRNYNTGIVARGRIYVAGDNQVYAFNAPGQTVTSITLTNLSVQPGGAFQFSFTNIPGALFNVFGTTNLTVPFANWTWLGGVPEISPGQYQFTDTQAPASSERFYVVNWP
jgi:hypothetical protein